MDEEMRLKIEQVVASLVPDLKPEVARIESSLATTKGHYGDYGGLLTTIAPSKRKAQIVALALIRAGADKQGVASALQYFY
jgi:hypothetical protein